MHRRLTLIGILCVLALVRADVLACTCIWAGPFFAVAPKEELLVRGKVVRYRASAMEVEVLEALKGTPNAATVWIWGDNGVLCRPYVTSFPLDTEWVFAVRPNPEGTQGGYVISGCGEYAVKVQHDTVSGRLTSSKSVRDSLETMSLTEFREKVQAQAR